MSSGEELPDKVFMLHNGSSIWKESVGHLPGSCVRSPSYRPENSPNTSQSSVEISVRQTTQATNMAYSPKKPVTNSRSLKPTGNSKSFQQFEQDTSDAWDVDDDDDILKNVKIDSKLIQATANHVITSHQKQSPAQYNDSTHAASHGDSQSSTRRIQSNSVTSTNHKVTSEPHTVTSRIRTIPDREQSKVDKFISVINGKSKNLIDDLRQLSWGGVHKSVRPITWRLLCGYMPAASERREQMLERKRQEYSQLLASYFDTRHDEQHLDTFRQIHIDVPRMNPLIPLFQNPQVQQIFERILYIWAIRHPASGYVQGINDLVTPFFIVFLTEILDHDVESETIDISSIDPDKLNQIEADSFWCMSKLLDGIQDNYTFAQPGIQRKVADLKELTFRINKSLHNHIEEQNIEFLQFSFRWMNNLLMRELPLRCTIRLWDTYLAEQDGFAKFHLFVCAAFLNKFSDQLLREHDFQGVMTKLQNLPTKNWTDSDVGELTAEAYRLKYMFAGAPQHYKAQS